MMLIRIVDHEVAALQFGDRKVRSSSLHAEVARRQQHDDVAAECEVRLLDRAVDARDDTPALEAERAAQPIDSGGDVTIAQRRHKPCSRGIGIYRHCSIPHTATITWATRSAAARNQGHVVPMLPQRQGRAGTLGGYVSSAPQSVRRTTDGAATLFPRMSTADGDSSNSLPAQRRCLFLALRQSAPASRSDAVPSPVPRSSPDPNSGLAAAVGDTSRPGTKLRFAQLASAFVTRVRRHRPPPVRALRF